MRGQQKTSSHISRAEGLPARKKLPRGQAGPTPFERSVYRAVSRIPRGRVRSYGWVARAIGRPGAARAVGNALKKNPLIGIVPCHRVIRSDGSLGGFTRGSRAKARMLKREGIDVYTLQLI